MKNEYYDHALLDNIRLCQMLIGRRNERPREYELINSYDPEEIQKACEDLDKRKLDDLRKIYEKR